MLDARFVWTRGVHTTAVPRIDGPLSIAFAGWSVPAVPIPRTLYPVPMFIEEENGISIDTPTNSTAELANLVTALD